jgi:hypothetical protein
MISMMPHQSPSRFLEEIAHRSPEDIMDEIVALDAESTEVLENIRELLK